MLLDFGGMSLSLLKLKTIFGTMNSIGSRYFPERTVLFFILNAPGIFSMMWNVVKGLVDPRTQKKINILSSGSRQIEGASLVWSSVYCHHVRLRDCAPLCTALREHLPDDVIPVAYGGSRLGPTCSGSNQDETSQMCVL